MGLARRLRKHVRTRFPDLDRLQGAARQYLSDLRLPSLAADRRVFARGIAWQNEILAALTVAGPASAPTFEVTQRPKLPPLAWLCRRRGGRFAFSVGPGVELFDGGLFEGVWTGPFGDIGGLEQACHFGSGALLGAVPLFLPPKHLLEAIYLLRDRRSGVDHISNSLCFCLADAGIVPGHPFFAVVEAEAVDNSHALTRLGAAMGNPVIASSDDVVLLRWGTIISPSRPPARSSSPSATPGSGTAASTPIAGCSAMPSPRYGRTRNRRCDACRLRRSSRSRAAMIRPPWRRSQRKGAARRR